MTETSGTTAAERVFGLPELLELIMSYLPVYSLFQMRNVDRLSRAMCEDSPTISHKMFLQQKSAAEIVDFGDESNVTVNPYLDTLITYGPALRVNTWVEPADGGLELDLHIHMRILTQDWMEEPVMSKNAPWHRSFLASHALRVVCTVMVAPQLKRLTLSVGEVFPAGSIKTVGELVAALRWLWHDSVGWKNGKAVPGIRGWFARESHEREKAGIPQLLENGSLTGGAAA